MTKKSDTKKIEQSQKSPWPKRLKRMKDHQKANSSDWKTNEKLLFGQETGGSDGETKKNPTTVAYGWALVKALETMIYTQNPDCLVEARDEKWRETAHLLTNACRYDFDQMDLKRLGNLGLIDNMTCGYAAIIETVEPEKTLRYPEDPNSIMVESQQYVARRILPKDILFDPQGLLLDLSDHRYIAVAFYPTIGQLREDPDFKDNLPENIEEFQESSPLVRENAKLGSGTGINPYYSAETDPDYKTICVWEIHDKIGGEIIYLTDDRNIEIGRMPAVRLQVGGRKLFPVTIMALHPVSTGFYPKPQLSIIANQLKMLNGLDNMIYEDALTKWRKYVASSKVINQEQRSKFTDTSQENALMIVEHDDLAEIASEGHGHEIDLRNLIVPVEDVMPKKDLGVVAAYVRQEVQEILGYGPMDRGGLPKTRSAREAVAIKEKMEQRVAKMADNVADFYRDFGQKHIVLLKKTMAVDRYARIISQASDLKYWQSYGPEQLEGDFEFVVYSGSSMPRTTESKRASELQLFQTVAPIIQALQLDIRPAFYRLARYFDWDGVDALFKNPKGVAKQLAMILAGVAQGKVPPQVLLEGATAMVKAELSDEEIAMLTRQASGGGVPKGAVAGSRGDSSPLKTSAGVA